MITRRTLLSVSIALGCLATVVAVLTGLYFVNAQINRQDRHDLRGFADKALMRSERVTGQAVAALADLARNPGASCTPNDLSQAARVIFNHAYMRDAGTYRDGQYLCSPLMNDVRTQRLTLPPPDWRSPDGYLVWFRLKSPLSFGREDVQIGRDGHYVSIDPKSFVDLIDPSKHLIETINTATGTTVALSDEANKEEMFNAWKLDGKLNGGKWNYAVAKSAAQWFSVVVRAPKSSLFRNWPKLLAISLSIGAVVGVGVGWLAFKRISRQFSFASALEWAIARKEIQVVYQPIVRLADNRCVGVEALVRWQLNGRAISPEIFVALAEENHLIQPLTDLVLTKTVAELTPLMRENPAFYASINLSSEDLRSERFLHVLTRALKRAGISPSQIPVEATERSFMNADEARSVIAAFRAAGHRVYIDDFGTGYSSLSYLHTFSLDVLKIDKSFVETITRDSASSVVAPHIIAMAHELGLEIVAEGVESESQVEYLREKGVQYIQGWYIAKPMPVAELREWLRTRPGASGKSPAASADSTNVRRQAGR